MASVKVTVRDLGWKRILKEIEATKGSHVDVGVLSDAGSYASDDGPVNLADVATFNEFGTTRIPSRPFMAQAFDANLQGLKTFIAERLSDVYQGRNTAAAGLRMIGVWFKGKVQETIAKGEFAENAPSTIAAKGSDKPLIDTGRLRQSIAFQVKMR